MSKKRTRSEPATAAREPARPQPGAFPGGKAAPEAGELRIAVDKLPYAEIIGHALIEPDVEVCGVLVGGVGEDEHGPFVHVRAAIRGQAARQAGAAVTFTHETWNHIHQELDRRYPDDEIVGWYHTHGGFGVFLSEDDTFIHQNFFTAPHHLAYVYDPLAGSEGFFVRQGEDGKLLPVRRYWMNGRERRPATRTPEAEKRPAASGAGAPGGAALEELAAAVKKMSVAVQWSAQERAEAAPGWTSWLPWIAAALALGLCLVLAQARREPAPASRAAVLVVDRDPASGKVSALPLVAVGPGGDAVYGLDVEAQGLELRTADGAVLGRFQGLSALRQAAAAEEQKRAEEARQASATFYGWLGWAAAVAGGVAALAAAAWWFLLRRR